MSLYHNHTQLMEKLLACVAACEHCATACLSEDNVADMAACIKLDRDCADICSQRLGFYSAILLSVTNTCYFAKRYAACAHLNAEGMSTSIAKTALPLAKPARKPAMPTTKR